LRGVEEERFVNILEVRERERVCESDLVCDPLNEVVIGMVCVVHVLCINEGMYVLLMRWMYMAD
jgi:hypothetical protein